MAEVRSAKGMLPNEHIYSNNSNEKLKSFLPEQLPDSNIFYRDKQFRSALGERMTRKSNENENSLHSLNQLNRLLSKSNCLIMQEYHIKSVEGLIRLFLEHGQEYFTQLMINVFEVHPVIVEQMNFILFQWAKEFTER